MTYPEAKAKRDELERAYLSAGDALRAVPGYASGPMGLTPDAVRATPEWQVAFSAHARAFQALRAFNAGFVKQFAREIREERGKKRA